MYKNTYYYLGDILKKFLFLFILFFFPLCVFADSGTSTIVMDVDSGRILYEKKINDKSLIASITKIMTCIIVLENSDIEKEITVGDEVLSMYGTNIYVEPGEKLRIIDLLYGLMLRSGNDAAISLAYNTLGEDKFIYEMNLKAKELGMNNTIFSNPHGLDDVSGNYSTVYDMALLAKYAYKNDIYKKIISTKKYATKSSLKSYVWYNRMSLLNNYKYCVGGKNGYTPRAGKTLVSYAKKNNLTLLIVSFNDSSLYNNHESLYNYYFSKYKKYLIVDKHKFKINSLGNNYKYYAKESFIYPLAVDEVDSIATLVKIDSNNVDNTVGTIEIRFNGELIKVIDIEKKKTQKKESCNLFCNIKNLFTG